MLRKRIKAWMTAVVADGGHRRFVDLHVDDADPRYTPKSEWMRGAFDCFASAVLVRNQLGIPFTVGVGVSLRSAPHRAGFAASSLETVANELDDSPPSLYLFARGEEPWINDEDFEEVHMADTMQSNLPMVVRLREWYDENDEDYRRSLWLCG